MPSMDRDPIDFQCKNPDCGRAVKATYRDAYTLKRVVCNRCRTEHRFNSGLASAVTSAVRDVERAQKKLETSVQRLLNERIDVKLR